MKPTPAQQPVLLEVSDGIAFLTLNRANAYNALDLAMVECAASITADIEKRDDVSVVVIRGAGKAFCAGGDVRAFAENIDNVSEVISSLLNALHGFLVTLRRMPQAVISSVHGAAAGAGLSLIMISDFAIASESAKFTAAYKKLGISPDGGGTFGSVRAMGAKRAMEMFLVADTFSATQAEQWGIVNRIVADEMLRASTLELALKIASSPLYAISATKRLVNQSLSESFERQLEAEAASVLVGAQSEYFKSTVKALTQRK